MLCVGPCPSPPPTTAAWTRRPRRGPSAGSAPRSSKVRPDLEPVQGADPEAVLGADRGPAQGAAPADLHLSLFITIVRSACSRLLFRTNSLAQCTCKRQRTGFDSLLSKILQNVSLYRTVSLFCESKTLESKKTGF